MYVLCSSHCICLYLMILRMHSPRNVSLFSDGLKELIHRKPAEERPHVVRTVIMHYLLSHGSITLN